MVRSSITKKVQGLGLLHRVATDPPALILALLSNRTPLCCEREGYQFLHRAPAYYHPHDTHQLTTLLFHCISLNKHSRVILTCCLLALIVTPRQYIYIKNIYRKRKVVFSYHNNHFKYFVWFIQSKIAFILLKIQNHQQANCKDSTVNDDMVVKKWDATFYSKLNILNICDFDFNKIFLGNLASPLIISILSNSKALECDMLVIRTFGIGNRTF